MDGSPRLTHMTRVLGRSVLGQLNIYAPSMKYDDFHTCTQSKMAVESSHVVQLAQAIRLVRASLSKGRLFLIVDIGCQKQQLQTAACLVLCTIGTYSNARCLLWN
jgi:hypothetical protein